MRRVATRTRQFRLLASGAAVAGLVALVCVWTIAAAQTPTDIVTDFKYGSIGTEDQEGLPYWIWQVLPKMFADKLPAGGYGALGMLWEPGHDLPIGFSQTPVDYRLPPPSLDEHGEEIRAWLSDPGGFEARSARTSTSGGADE